MATTEVIGGWTALEHGQETGKAIEYVVFRVRTDRGGTFEQAQFFKPFQMTDRQTGQPTWARGTRFGANQLAELVDRINHFNMNYGSKNGVWVFQPAQGQAAGYVAQGPAQAPQGQAVGAQPQYQQPPTQYAGPPPQQPTHAPPPQHGQPAPGYPPVQQGPAPAPQGGPQYVPPGGHQ